jgi:hypothetical protein
VHLHQSTNCTKLPALLKQETCHQTRLGSPQHATGTTLSVEPQHPPRTNGSHFDLPNQEGAFLLLEFRTSMARQFPFAVIPPNATSESLRTERPMLWKAILTAASCLKPSRQVAMGQELIEEFSTRLLLNGEKSLDLLQALPIHIAWSVIPLCTMSSSCFLPHCTLTHPLTLEQVSLPLNNQSTNGESDGFG